RSQPDLATEPARPADPVSLRRVRHPVRRAETAAHGRQRPPELRLERWPRDDRSDPRAGAGPVLHRLFQAAQSRPDAGAGGGADATDPAVFGGGRRAEPAVAGTELHGGWHQWAAAGTAAAGHSV